MIFCFIKRHSNINRDISLSHSPLSSLSLSLYPFPYVSPSPFPSSPSLSLSFILTLSLYLSLPSHPFFFLPLPLPLPPPPPPPPFPASQPQSFSSSKRLDLAYLSRQCVEMRLWKCGRSLLRLYKVCIGYDEYVEGAVSVDYVACMWKVQCL